MADENIVPLEQCKDFINANYVSKLLAFLNGNSQRVTTHAEYMKVYSLIIWQCDSNDSNEQINMIFQEFAEEYLQNQVLPKIQNKNGEQLLTNLVEVWHNYNIYSKMMDRSFDYASLSMQLAMAGTAQGLWKWGKGDFTIKSIKLLFQV